tara:strand:- start:221 stop:772 length:552 start_codon:yes stop_codon:yes gene_type:complete
MIEDQVAPKACGHTQRKAVVPFDEALMRVRAAVDASRALAAQGDDIVILARTDARACLGLDEAIRRCQVFREAGADMTFLEAPLTVDEMRAYCSQVEGPKLANILAGGRTPQLPPTDLEAMGFAVAAYPLDLINASIVAMRATLKGLKKSGSPPKDLTLPFSECMEAVGFDEYYKEADQYKHH